MPKANAASPSWQDDFTVTNFNHERVLLHEGNVWVTEANFINGTQYHPIKSMTSAAVTKGKTITWKSMLALLAGIGLLTVQTYVGLAVIAGVVLYWAGHKPSYVLSLEYDGETVVGLTSTDGKFLTQVYDAIVLAIEHNKQAG